MFSIHDVMSDGSCFYRSVFNVLKAHGVLERFCRCFLDDIVGDEDRFVKQVRHRLSIIIKNRDDHNIIKSIYKTLKAYDEESYALVLESLPSWLQKEFPSKPESLKAFRTVIAKRIAHMKSWASEIDIRLFTLLFEKCLKGYKLFIFNGVPKQSSFKPEKNTLYLINIGEVHYNYIVLKQQPKKRKSARIINY